MKPEYFWGAAIGSMVVIDVYVSRQGQNATLSSAARRTFRVHTKAGRLLFVCGWVALTSWLVPHIIQDAVVELVDDWTEQGP